MPHQSSQIWLLRRREVLARTGLSNSEMHRRIKAGSFPAPIALGPNSVAWPSNAIDAWIEAQIAQAGSPKTCRAAAAA